MTRLFGTLLDGGPPTDVRAPTCRHPGCGAESSFRLRADVRIGAVDRPVYLEAWCLDHVPASWFPKRDRQ